MINGIIKLFYSEIVKSKIKKMPNEEYSLRDEYKGVYSTFTKIDNIFIKIFKVLFSLIVVLLSLNINISFGIGVALIIMTYSIYNLYIEETSKSDVILNIKPKIYS